MEGSNQLQKGIDSSVLFGGNAHFSFVFRKTEKLVTAVYMITDFIKDSEPLKWKIREDALALLSLNVSFATVSLSERRELIKEYHSLALEIVSLSGVAKHSGLISEMNFEILSREFSNLVANLERSESKKASEETVVLDPSFFAADEPKGHQPQPSRTEAIAPRPSEFAPVSHVKDIPQIAPRPARVSEPKDGKESRRGAILKLLSKKGGLSIKDFADSIKGVSEKTIQRELLAMVAAGVLKKEGERRWSTYSLAS